MRNGSVELTRAAGLQLLRGAVLLVSACIAIRWPEMTLLLALVGAGVVCGALGVIEIAGAAASELLPSSRTFHIANGLVFVGFGTLVVSIPVATIEAATTLTVAWLLASGAFALLLGARVWHLRTARLGLLLMAGLNVLCAAAAFALPARNVTVLMMWGALYMAFLGAVELAAGHWMNRNFTLPTRRAAAAGRVGGTSAAAR